MKLYNSLITSLLITFTLSQQDTISNQCVTLCKQLNVESTTNLRQCTFECLQVVNRSSQPNRLNVNSVPVVPTLHSTVTAVDSTFTASSVLSQASESISSHQNSQQRSRTRSSDDEPSASSALSSDSISASLSNSASYATISSNLKPSSSSKSASKSKSVSDNESSAIRIPNSLILVAVVALYNLI